MSKIRRLKRRHISVTTRPVHAFQARFDWGLYKDCYNEQTTLAGKKRCYSEYRPEKSEGQ
jgi:hypothetical protein